MTNVSAAPWISAETEPKERDFRGILGMHLNICRGIRSRRPGPPYLYIDLHGGPGQLEFEGRTFAGSPLIFAEEVTARALDHRSAHFEADAPTAAALAELLATQSIRSIVCSERFEDGLVNLVRSVPNRETTLGLVYSDPIRDPIPHVHLNYVADLLPRVDLMAYVSATQYKRRNGARRQAGLPDGPRLADDILAVRKSVVLVREPHTAWQWTFIVWSNWVDFPEWRKQGFHRLDSAKGQQILRGLNHTDAELHALTNAPLPLDQPYRTYREYLQHPRWLRVRAKVFERAGGVCERCGLRPPKDPHHLRYPPWGEFDVPENIIAICHECHCEVHGKAS